MLAAGASNAAITRSRSPSWSPEKRSTIRYCIGLASGTGRLLHQLFHDLHGVFPGPVHLTERTIARVARGIDHERHDRGRRCVASQAHGERQPISFEVMVYLKLSGSSESSRPSAVSLCGYIRNAILPLVELGRLRSCAVL